MGRKKTLRSSGAKQEGGGSSSEDTEQQKTMNIINRLSKKYLKTSIKSDSEQQENKRRSSRRLKDQNKGESLEYDADVETSAEEPSVSDSSMKSVDLYDFDQSEEGLRLVLFPEESSHKKSNKPLVKGQTKKSSKSSTGLGKKQKKPSEKKPEITKKRPLDSRDAEQNQVKRRKASPTSSISSLSSFQSSVGSFSDSGVFLSPISRSLRSSNTSTPANAATSTPAIILAGKPNHSVGMMQDSTGDSGCFAFDPALSPSPILSPVRKSPRNDTPMDLGSPKLKTPIAERTYANIVRPFSSVKKLTSPMPIAHEPPKKKRSRKEQFSTSRYDNWATKMNTEFDEIEMFELSIEG